MTLKGTVKSCVGLPVEDREKIAFQLRSYVRELGPVRGDFYGGMRRSECRDLYRSLLRWACGGGRVRHSYGWFDSREGYDEACVGVVVFSPSGGTISRGRGVAVHAKKC